MTTRKLVAAPASLAISLAVGGCATPGPLHVYGLGQATAAVVTDSGPPPASDVATFLAPGESVTGFAYDPFTDHFFLRLSPGNRIRVVDRPARAIKREFTVEKLAANRGGDLAVRPRDGHLFLVLPNEPALLEATRFGEYVRKIGLQFPAAGVAVDSTRNRLLVSFANSQNVVAAIDDAGVPISTVLLLPPSGSASLGYDSDRREFYQLAPLKAEVWVFDERGQFRRAEPLVAEFFDVGPRSFLRMF